MKNYLKKTITIKDNKNIIDCNLTNNYDEHYIEIYPKITKEVLLKTVVNYPDFSYKSLESLIYKKFGAKYCALGSGSENLIIQINKFLANKSLIGVVSPIFYRVIETLKDVPIKIFKEEEFLKNNLWGNIDAIWIQNPNLFTGKIYDKNLLLNIIDTNKNILFIIDEAGIFTLLNWKTYSLLSEANKRKNLIVVASFSKIFGISGLRAGFAAGPKKIMDIIKKDNLTFPISSITIKFIEKILAETNFIQKIKQKIEKNKDEIESILLKNNITIIKNRTNCIFFKHPSANMHKELLKQKILTLNLNNILEESGFVRMTAHSSKSINEKVKKRLKDILSKI